jgi:hypothetical protein
LSDYFFDYLFPLAIEFGMTSEEFWKDDPKLFSSYQKAYIEKEKRNNEKINYSNWLLGLYIYDGFSKSLARFGLNFLSGKRANENKYNYPSEPYDLYGEKNKREELRKIKKRKENQANLNFWARIKG